MAGSWLTSSSQRHSLFLTARVRRAKLPGDDHIGPEPAPRLRGGHPLRALHQGGGTAPPHATRRQPADPPVGGGALRPVVLATRSAPAAHPAPRAAPGLHRADPIARTG